MRQKIESSFSFMFLKQNFSLNSHHQSLCRRKLPTSPRKCFLKNYLPFPSRKEEEVCGWGEGLEKIVRELKQWPKLNLWRNWSEVLIYYTIFGPIAFLAAVLWYHNSNSSLFKYEGSPAWQKIDILFKNSVQEFVTRISANFGLNLQLNKQLTYREKRLPCCQWPKFDLIYNIYIYIYICIYTDR